LLTIPVIKIAANAATGAVVLKDRLDFIVTGLLFAGTLGLRLSYAASKPLAAISVASHFLSGISISLAGFEYYDNTFEFWRDGTAGAASIALDRSMPNVSNYG